MDTFTTVNTIVTEISNSSIDVGGGEFLTYSIYRYNGTLDSLLGSVTSTTNEADFSSSGITLYGGTDYAVQVTSTGGNGSFSWRSRPVEPGDLAGTGGVENTFLLRVEGTNADYVYVNLPQPVVTGFGPEGTAASFDGIDDYMYIDTAVGSLNPGVSPVPSSGPFTVMAWAKRLTNQSGNRQFISNGANFQLGQHSSLNIRAGGDWLDTGVPYPTDGQWHHFALVKEVSETYLYLDGVLVATRGSAISNPNADDLLLIGRTHDLVGQTGINGEYFHGLVDEVRIFNTALPEGDVICNMTSTPTGFEPELVARYDMENTCGFREFDNRPFGAPNDGSLNTLFISTQTASVNTFWKPSIDIIGTWDYELAGTTYDGKGSYLKDEVPDSVIWTTSDLIFGIDTLCSTTIMVPPAFTSEIELEVANRSVENIQESMTLYPNPANNVIIVEIVGLTEDSNLKMFDFSGRLRYQTQIDAGTKEVKIDIEDRDYDPGMYIVEMVINDQIFTEKVFVIK